MTELTTTGVRAGKNLSVRLTAAHLDIVSALAQIDGITLGEVIRNAVMAYGDLRRQAPDFQEQVDRAKRQLDAVLVPTAGA